MATACGSCHVGGSLVEKSLLPIDENTVGERYTKFSEQPPVGSTDVYNPYMYYVAEYYTPVTGKPAHYLNDMCMNSPYNSDGTPVVAGLQGNNSQTTCTTVVPSETDTTSLGFAPAMANWQYPYPVDGNGDGDYLDAEDNPNFMMPNVREMDCFMCHLDDFNNIVNSAAVQMGFLNAAPAMGAGLMNMFSQSYIPGTVELDPTTGVATLSGSFLSRLKAEPPTENCRQCHIPSNMANMSEMFDKFLSSAPMEFNKEPVPNGSPLNGMAMPSYDLNAPLLPSGATSPEITFDFYSQQWVYTNGGSAAGPFGLFPLALDSSWSMFQLDADGTLKEDENGINIPNMGAVAGGGRPGATGPLYYAGAATNDQNALKKATIPFPRADFFKRGDIWEPEMEVHYRLGCGGCHFNANTREFKEDLNQCDPGRGRTRMGGVESGQVAIDTHETVKRCQDCHITGRNIGGLSIETFGAPNPNAAHAAAGLTATITTAQTLDGPQPGNHLDVMDCTVCHVYKKSMAVRSLDSTSGNRYPAMIGFPANKGTLGMFTDPMDADSMGDDQAVQAVRGMFSQMGLRNGEYATTGDSIGLYMAMVLYGVKDMESGVMADPVWGPVVGEMMMTNFPNAFNADGTINYGDISGDLDAMMGLMGTLSANFPGMPEGSTMGDAARALLKSEMQEWRPIYGWWAGEPETLPDGTPNPNWRRKLIPINFIVAQMWDDAADSLGLLGEGVTIKDANNDGGEAADRAPGTHSSDVQWDPWISRDMKAGMNFAAGPFGTIPVGYGDKSAYNADFTFTGNFQYVGVYGGNAMLTTPEEIAAYKTLRGSEWDNTQLVFFGGNPFQVTHNVVGTNVHALGKNGCTDCHSTEAGFFSGAYDMTGGAIPASREYDYDASGFTFGMDMADATTSNFMYRPVVDFEVTALKNDLRTGSEAFAKDGTFVDVEFDECLDSSENVVDCTDAAAVYRRTHDLGRDEFMYPELDDAARSARITELETLADEYASDPEKLPSYLLVDPVAKVASAEVSGENIGDTTVYTGSAVTITADASVNTDGFFTYTWSSPNGDITTSGEKGEIANVTFPTQGSYQVVLKVQDEEGKVDMEVTTVTVKPAPVSAEATVVSGTAPGEVTVAFSGLPYDTATGTYGYDELVVYWGDGEVDKYYAHNREWERVALLGTTGTEELTHEYAEAGPYKVKLVIYTYNTTTERYEPIEVDPSRESIITVEAAPVTTP